MLYGDSMHLTECIFSQPAPGSDRVGLQYIFSQVDPFFGVWSANFRPNCTRGACLFVANSCNKCPRTLVDLT